jgi:hypothetical protein
MLADLENSSSEDVTIKRVAFSHPRGIGSILRVEAIRLAPLGSSPGTTTPGGLYRSFPPVAQRSRSGPCYVQRLVSVDGYTLRPGHEARVAIVLSPEKAGTAGFDSHVVYYTQAGKTFRQTITVGLRVKVDAKSAGLPVSSSERACAAETTILP